MIASGDGFESRGGDWRVGCDEVRMEAPVRPEVGLAGNARPVKRTSYPPQAGLVPVRVAESREVV